MSVPCTCLSLSWIYAHVHAYRVTFSEQLFKDVARISSSYFGVLFGVKMFHSAMMQYMDFLKLFEEPVGFFFQI